MYNCNAYRLLFFLSPPPISIG